MPAPILPEDLQQIIGRETLFAFLRAKLDWPVEPEDAFTYPLNLPGLNADAEVSRLVPFSAEDPYPIVLVETTAEFRRSTLREVLRRVRAGVRERGLFPDARTEDLVFVVASDGYRDLRFCRFTERAGAQPRLSAFGWRTDQPSGFRTLIDHNLDKLRMPPKNLLGEADWTLAQWHEAWDVERVTREFFKEYRRVFERVEEMIGGVRGDRRLFTQRLFNRLLFIRFLEKKDWLEFDEDRDYLRALRRAAAAADENFYEQRLYHVFFHGLGVINDDRKNHDVKYWENRRGKVPFLNGGLFEMEDDDQFGRAKIPNEAFDLILDELFTRFNFTITESTPNDVEVAVDPEMLGKVFEELVTGRHETGSYYTPRPVVAFMCREALKGYLAASGVSSEKVAALVDRREVNDAEAGPLSTGEARELMERLLTVKVVDPACGSGAYLLGMLHELFEMAGVLEVRAEKLSARDQYHRKLRIIQNCLYGVDLDEFAVNIARLRLWLSLTVEFEGSVPEPLPNLDFKIEVGDSLLAPDPSGGLQPDLFRQQQVEEFRAKKAAFADPYAKADKAALRKEIEALRGEIRAWAHPKGEVAGFDWAVEFAEVFQAGPEGVTLGASLNLGPEAGRGGQAELAEPGQPGGFDIVLANPPYVRQV